MKKRKIFRKGATVTFLSPQKEKSLDPLKIKAFLLAEKEGFEPSRRSTRPTPLAGEPLRPLGYFRRPVIKLAERVGFEPTDAFTSPVFKTGAFDHSAISPCVKANLCQKQI